MLQTLLQSTSELPLISTFALYLFSKVGDNLVYLSPLLVSISQTFVVTDSRRIVPYEEESQGEEESSMPKLVVTKVFHRILPYCLQSISTPSPLTSNHPYSAFESELRKWNVQHKNMLLNQGIPEGGFMILSPFFIFIQTWELCQAASRRIAGDHRATESFRGSGEPELEHLLVLNRSRITKQSSQ
jgi:hypothetical protein